MSKFPAPSPKFIPAKYHGGAQTPKMVVMHSTVGPTKKGSAYNIARYFRLGPSTPSSAHYVVDAATTYQCVGDHTVAYHCGYNQDSIGVEMCDYPTTLDWERWKDQDHRDMFDRAVKLVASLCLAYGIPPFFVGPIRLRLGFKGVTTHNNMSIAFRKSTHWDPGKWPRRKFMRAVRAEMRARKKAAK
jgi:N-acetylmuramoyl-L-alanine amidase CwlA